MRRISKWGIILLSIGWLAACTTNTVTNHRPPERNLVQAAAINVKLGLSYLQQGNIAQAKQKLLLAQQQHASAEVYRALAYFYEKTNNFKQANDYYQQAIAKAPTAGAGHNNYGVFLCRQKQYQPAEQQFLAAANDPNYLHTAAAYENAGLCALLIPDQIKAEKYFTQALQQNPNMLTSLRQLATLNYQQQQYQQAGIYLQRYIKIGQPDTDTLWLGVKIAKQLNDAVMLQKYGRLLKTHFPQSTQFAQYQKLIEGHANG